MHEAICCYLQTSDVNVLLLVMFCVCYQSVMGNILAETIADFCVVNIIDHESL